MARRLRTDIQFEKAFKARATVYAKDRQDRTHDVLGALEAFNPIFVTVSGSRLFRDDYEFLIR
jgi:hypothetical protein